MILQKTLVFISIVLPTAVTVTIINVLAISIIIIIINKIMKIQIKYSKIDNINCMCLLATIVFTIITAIMFWQIYNFIVPNLDFYI